MNEDLKIQLRILIDDIEEGKYPRYLVDRAILLAGQAGADTEQLWDYAEELYAKYDAVSEQSESSANSAGKEKE